MLLPVRSKCGLYRVTVIQRDEHFGRCKWNDMSTFFEYLGHGFIEDGFVFFLQEVTESIVNIVEETRSQSAFVPFVISRVVQLALIPMLEDSFGQETKSRNPQPLSSSVFWPVQSCPAGTHSHAGR